MLLDALRIGRLLRDKTCVVPSPSLRKKKVRSSASSGSIVLVPKWASTSLDAQESLGSTSVVAFDTHRELCRFMSIFKRWGAWQLVHAPLSSMTLSKTDNSAR